MAPQPDSERRILPRTSALAALLAEFSARAGHDLIGPINQASSLLALFVHQQKCGPDAEASVLLEHLQNCNARMQVVVAAVQQFLAIASDMRAFAPVDLNGTVAAARQRVERQIAEHGAVISHDALPVITANGDQMTTLFENLLRNAIRFRRPDVPPLIRISVRQSGSDWVFAVADNGIGIDSEYREVVFQPFRRLHGKEYPGAGMGLTTAKLIAGMHGGEIRIDPGAENAHGTAVLFKLPGILQTEANV